MVKLPSSMPHGVTLAVAAMLFFSILTSSGAQTPTYLGGVAVPPPPPAEPPPSDGSSRPGQAARLTINRDLEYATAGTHALHLDLYLRGAADKKPLPLVVWIHGDDSTTADKSPTPAARLVANGYAVASVEYREAGELVSQDQLLDVKAAVRWLRAHSKQYNLDGDHIGVWGEGSGGTLASLLGTTGDVKALKGIEGNLDQSSRVQAVIDFFGPVDLLRMDTTASHPKSNDPHIAEKAKAVNPTTFISANAPPFLIVQGDADTTMPARQSEFLQVALMRAGVENDLEYVVGAGHSMDEVETPAIADLVTNFFDKHLREDRHQRDDVNRIGEPGDSWIDAFPDNLPGTQSKLYATPSRHPRTWASYRLYLPPDYDLQKNARRRYPVIYFLHGFGDDSREALISGYIARVDAAIRAGLMPPTIVICVQSPNGSSYEDSADGQVPAESAIIKDLIPAVDKAYRTIALRQGRAIDGHSMGGTGSLRLGFKYPELFGSVSAISPAMTSGGSTGIVLDDPQSPWAMAVKNADRIRGQTYIQLIEGDDDGGPRGGLLRIQWMSAVLDRLNLAHNFILSPGAKHPVKDELSRLETTPFVFYDKAFAKFK